MPPPPPPPWWRRAAPAGAGAPPLPVMTKFGATFYGFAEFDAIWDSTQSFNDLAGNSLIAHTPAATMRR